MLFMLFIFKFYTVGYMVTVRGALPWQQEHVPKEDSNFSDKTFIILCIILCNIIWFMFLSKNYGSIMIYPSLICSVR